jgi:hypothetical protein
MARKKSRRRGSGIIVLLAVIAALAGGPSAVAADLDSGFGDDSGLVASWAEE